MVEIRELVIRTRISEKKTAGDESLPADEKTQEIVRSCVEEVLKVLKREKER